jgi:hypothetical protein
MAIKANFPDIKPSLNLDFANTKRLDPRITFTRASTATYYDGKTVAKAEENLLIRSEEFDNAAWVKLNVTVTANNTTAPDGTTTADAVFETAITSGFAIYQGSTSAGIEYAISVFAKSNVRDTLVIRGSYKDTNDWISAEFDLTSVTATLVAGSSNTGTNTSASITDAGGGWYRCNYVFTPASGHGTTTTRFYISDGTSISGTINGVPPDYAGDITKGLYLWGAQLEQRSSVTAYTPTITQPITNYIPALQSAASGEARFDHDPVTGESLGLLIEEQRTNLFERSEEFDNGYWTKAGVTVTANTVVAPDGTLTADKCISSSGQTLGSINSSIRRSLTKAASAITYTLSVYAKKAEHNRLTLILTKTDLSSVASVTYSLENGSVVIAAAASGSYSNASSVISDVGNGWYRVSLTVTTDTGTGLFVIIDGRDSVATTGDGFSGIFIWGAQLEVGAFPTSYIPTTSATVTRAADAASMTGTNFSSWYRADEGTMFADFKFNGLISFPDVFSIGSSTTNFISISKNFSDLLRGEVVTNGATTVNATTLITASFNNDYKLSMAFATNNTAVTTDGASPTLDTDCTIPVATSATIGNRTGSTTNPLNGTIKKLSYYPARVTNTELQGLTL